MYENHTSQFLQCPDWRNPGSIYDPAELISTGLMHVVETTQSLFNELAQA